VDSELEQMLRRAFSDVAVDKQDDCPDSEDLIAFIEGSLSEGKRQEIAVHVAVCAHCAVETGRVFKAHLHYERSREKMLERTAERLKAEGLWARPSWKEALARLLSASQEIALPAVLLRRFALFASVSFAVLLLAAAVLLTSFLYERGKNAGLRESLSQQDMRRDVAQAIREGLRDTNELLMMMSSSQTENVAHRIEQIEVLELKTQSGEIPYPTLRPLAERQSLLTIALDSDPESRAQYVDFLEQWSKVFQQMGDTLVQTGKVEEAIRVFEYLARKNPESKPLLFALGELYKMMASGDDSANSRVYHEKAIGVYEEILRRDPRDPRPLNYAGFSYYRIKNHTKALEYYDKATSISPGYAKVYFNKALAYRDMPDLTPAEKARLFEINFQKALSLTLDAYRAQGESDPRVSFTLAVLYAESGKLADSLFYLEKAVRRNPFYITRAEKERAFQVFRESSHREFFDILNRYRPAQGRFGLQHEPDYNPGIFAE
jgi:tetratricopeptide (TPR) repeat protein